MLGKVEGDAMLGPATAESENVRGGEEEEAAAALLHSLSIQYE